MNVGLDYVAFVAIFMALCAVIDFRTRKIPNWLTVPAVLAGLAYHGISHGGTGALYALAGFALGFCLLLLPWLLGGGGMGDVKMLAALGAWLGPVLILVAFGLGAMLAACGAMGVMASSLLCDGFSATRKRYVAAGPATAPPASPRKGKRVLPFAVPMALATWMVLAWMLLRTAA
jgi:prepilin peptidase CpaA